MDSNPPRADPAATRDVGVTPPPTAPDASNVSQTARNEQPNQPVESRRVRPSEKHISILDALRGIAILLVLAFHFCEGLSDLGPIENVFYGFFRVGWIGVDLFFVLSGFLITGILVDTRSLPNRASTFYMRRTLRIFPLYFGFLIVVFLVLPAIEPFFARYHLSGGARTFGGLIDPAASQHQSWFWTYTTNFLLAWNPSALGSYGHFWSLAVEEQFYLVWPALIYALRPTSLLVLCRYCFVGALALRIVLLISGASAATNVLMPCRMDSLAAGAYVALAWRMDMITPAFVRTCRYAAIAAATALVGAFVARGFRLDATDPLIQSVGYSVIAVLFAALLVLCVMGGQLQWLNRPVFRTFGKYSYAIYVFHRPLHPILFALFGFSAFTASWTSQMARLIPFLVLAPVACLMLGLISWHVYERHFLSLRRFFRYS